MRYWTKAHGDFVAADKDQKYLNHQESENRRTCSSWIPRISRTSSNSRRFRRFGSRKSNLATSFQCTTTLCWSSGERLLDHEKDLWSAADGWLQGSRCEHSYIAFRSVALQSAVHLGQDYSHHLWSITDQLVMSVEQLFRTPQKLIKNQVECDRAVHVMKYLRVLPTRCKGLGGMSTVPVQAWKDKIKLYLETRCQRFGSGEQMKCGWKVFTGFTTLVILDEIQKMMEE